VLLLTFLLGEQQRQERRRILIDTILRLSKKTAYSICQAAGVQPGNLSAFRRPKGANLVSSELQDRLLAALGWSGGEPDPGVLHEWAVRDTEGLIALKWLLLDQSTVSASIQPLPEHASGGLDLEWGGTLSKNGAPCRITIGRYLKSPDGMDVQSMMNSLISSEVREKVSRERAESEKIEGAAATELLRHLVKGDQSGAHLVTTDGLFGHRVELGLNNEMLDQLILDWICQQARDVPDSIAERLSKIENLQILEENFAPSEMTKTQLKRFVKKLAKSAKT
jgi:hypothetical protein